MSNGGRGGRRNKRCGRYGATLAVNKREESFGAKKRPEEDRKQGKADW